MLGKCPFCEKNISKLKLNTGVSGNFNVNVNVITHCCPSCSKILSAEVDPLAIKSDTVTELKRAIGR